MTVERAIAVIDGGTYDTTQAATVAWVYDEHSLESGYEGIKRRLMHQANGKFFLFELLGALQKPSDDPDHPPL